MPRSAPGAARPEPRAKLRKRRDDGPVGRLRPATVGGPGHLGSDGPRRAVTFDLWYTLLYLRRSEQRRVAAARRRVWTAPLLRLGLSRPQSLRALQETETWGEAAHARGRAPSVPRHAAWLARRLGVVLPVEEIVEELDRLIRAADVRTAPGGREAVRSLRRSGVKTGLVSTVMNESGDATRELLSQHGLAAELDVVILSCERGFSKPRPEPFREVMRALGASAASSAHVGDDRYDIEGARAAGLFPFLYTGLERYRPVPPLRPPAREVRAAQVVDRWERFPALVVSDLPERAERKPRGVQRATRP